MLTYTKKCIDNDKYREAYRVRVSLFSKVHFIKFKFYIIRCLLPYAVLYALHTARLVDYSPTNRYTSIIPSVRT